MYKRKVFTHVPDPATKPACVLKTFEQVADPGFKPKYVIKKPGVPLPPPVFFCAPERPSTPVCVPPPPVPSKPRAAPVRRVVPPPVPKPVPVAKPIAKPIAKLVAKPLPIPVVLPKPIVEPAPKPAPLPEPPTGSRAWKIHQFIKANFKC